MLTAPDTQVATGVGEEPPLALTGGNANVLTTLSIAMMGFGGLMRVGARRARNQELDV